MRIATWNVNSLKARLPNVLEWLERVRPDVVCLQELKCETAAVPAKEIEALGYEVHAHGQKTYNGVALLSRLPVTDIRTGLDGEPEDAQARYIEGTVAGIRIASLYLPNGNPVGTEKYPHKLRWMDRLTAHARTLLATGRPFVLAGDYNVIPEARDCFDPKAWAEDALYRGETRAKFRTLLNLGLTEAFRALHPRAEHAWTFWDYQAGCWPRDLGIRIDHALLSPQAADRLLSAEIDREPRGREKASDHTPLIVELRD
ncbi:MAG: exodeoxyribonuclease [Pseudomonadota bacterium]|jgi:exodeoxyribonuclease-3